MIPQYTIEHIKEAANDDIVSVVEDYVKLKRSGNSYKGLCPFHDENTPSFSVSESKRIYKCFGCGEGGDAVDFLMKLEGYDFIECIRALAGRFGIIIDEEKFQRDKNYTPPNAIIPGIRQAKRHIRKEGEVIVCYSKNILRKLNDDSRKNTLLLKKLGSKQAELLAKYTQSLIIICEGIGAKDLLQTLKIAHGYGFSVKLATSVQESPMHWSAFINQYFDSEEAIRKACIKIIAAIPDGVTRGIETTFFLKNWDKSNQKE